MRGDGATQRGQCETKGRGIRKKGRSALEKETEKKAPQAAAASCHTFMSGKGRRHEKKKE